eukprot:CAMPEP_0169443006 /NCGR_PEP_ID=MMETSP1042-20121227/9127_1 /TAXON_ID=464988 /ORGANISM="Hemiselmis andersenii, Strain CCMP1180" /LENGTH=102 /DNA_ID=CAMNT_0009554209 /DNA_START=105 /DNA_END=410 /DNA_ORIENTATION=-
MVLEEPTPRVRGRAVAAMGLAIGAVVLVAVALTGGEAEPTVLQYAPAPQYAQAPPAYQYRPLQAAPQYQIRTSAGAPQYRGPPPQQPPQGSYPQGEPAYPEQ